MTSNKGSSFQVFRRTEDIEHSPREGSFQAFRQLGELHLEFEHFQKHCRDDQDINDRLVDLVMNVQLTKRLGELDFIDNAFPELAHSGNEFAFILAGKWGEHGFPHVSVEQKLAASLMASDVDPSFADEVVAPWPIFAITIPPLISSMASHLLVSTRTSKKFDVSPTLIAAMPSPLVLGEKHSGVMLYGSLGDMIRQRPFSLAKEGSTFAGHGAAKMAKLVASIVSGVCVEMATRPGQDAIRCKSEHKALTLPANVRKDVPFVLGRPVNLDLREAVREMYSDTPSKDLSSGHAVRTLVRGHHKRQVCGVGRSERKWVHIEPYWRGPEEAPLAVRAHALSA